MMISRITNDSAYLFVLGEGVGQKDLAAATKSLKFLQKVKKAFI